MTKSKLIKDIYSRLDGATKVQVRDFLNAFTISVVETLQKEGSITLPDLVKIVVVKTPAKPERMARNPATGTQIKVAPKPAGKKLKARFVRYLKGEVGQLPRSAKAIRTPKTPKAKAPKTRVARTKAAKPKE
jgi:nucleoid DNA-binding protein